MTGPTRNALVPAVIIVAANVKLGQTQRASHGSARVIGRFDALAAARSIQEEIEAFGWL